MVQAPPGQQRPSADRVFRGLRIASGVEGKGQPSVLWTGSSPATPQRAQPGGSSRRAGPRRFQHQSCRKVSSGLRIKETGSAGLTACFEQRTAGGYGSLTGTSDPPCLVWLANSGWPSLRRLLPAGPLEPDTPTLALSRQLVLSPWQHQMGRQGNGYHVFSRVNY